MSKKIQKQHFCESIEVRLHLHDILFSDVRLALCYILLYSCHARLCCQSEVLVILMLHLWTKQLDYMCGFALVACLFLQQVFTRFTHPQTCAQTYVRCENNGWRPVIGTPAEQTGPKVVLRVPNFGGFFSNSPDERRILKLLALKKRKRAWLKKLYAEGRAAEFDKPSAVNLVEPTCPSDSEFPDLELLRWSAGLDFDKYERDWYSRAISLSEWYDQDWHKLGTCVPGYDLPACSMPVVRTPCD